MAYRASQSILLSLAIGLIFQACQHRKDCNDPLGCIPLEESKSIVIAAALPLSGRHRDTGKAWLARIEAAVRNTQGPYNQGFHVISLDLNSLPENSQEVAQTITAEEGILLVIAMASDPFDQSFARMVSDAGQAVLWLDPFQREQIDLPAGNLLLHTPSIRNHRDVIINEENGAGFVEAASLWIFQLASETFLVSSTEAPYIGRGDFRSRLEQTGAITISGWEWDCTTRRICVLIQAGSN
jgi:hypothetical protein